ncbi:Acyltransferase-like protein [Acorus calamus]|uniref:Acyltransferase-like protein n=1 Tax=Acorus calamus TaxID=4465 RepID=A0AAV9EWI7_ACOCL|nr:Acyltransferase-like protein [Acorus calamus]
MATVSHPFASFTFPPKHRPRFGRNPRPVRVRAVESTAEKPPPWVLDEAEVKERTSVGDYVARSRELMRSDGGPPRWFSPVECGPDRLEGSPLLLFLPGFHGIGTGLILHHRRLGKIFDVWCLHIPISDRTPFEGLVDFVERTIKSESSHLPSRPIYLVGDSFGGCLALAVAARNPDADLILILANPATSFIRSQLQPIFPVLDVVPEQLYDTIPQVLSFAGNSFRMAVENAIKELPQTVGELIESTMLLGDVLPKETFLWKLKMVKSASLYANSRLHAVKSQTLVLASGKDQLLPSREEAARLRGILPNCRIRYFDDSTHAILLDGSIDLVTIIKGAGFYRRSRQIDFVSDYIFPMPDEVKKIYEDNRWVNFATSPVMLSTLENGQIVRGLSGIPSEGPVVFVGYHMLLGWELAPMVLEFLKKKNILLRGIAHPFMFNKASEELMPDSSSFDYARIMGAVPVSATSLYKLLSRKSFVLLYPGGAREALHRKGEEYKLFWPEQSEFVRMSAKFGAKIIPFAVMGEDDVCELLADYDDLVRLPFIKDQIKYINQQDVRLRANAAGEVGNQDLHLPWMLPKFPGRFYYLFGRPIETEGMEEELRDRERAQEFYLQVKSEVENCMSYLKEKREKDPYRNLLPRVLHQATHGFSSEIPTFEL